MIWRHTDYERAKDTIEPGGEGLGRGFLQHFLPLGAVPRNGTLQATITGIYEERWRKEGDRLAEQSRLMLWQGQEANDKEKIGQALELEKQSRVLNGMRGRCRYDPAWTAGWRALIFHS